MADAEPIPRPLPPTPDLSRWQALSPLLDELLDLDDAARAERLAALRADDAALADDLAALLARDAALAGDGFLEAPALAAAPGTAGQRLGAYTLEHELGRGGMGSVWLARRSDGRYDAAVAIKLLHSGLFGAGDAGRFAREGQILARLDHPHIARLLDAGVGADGQQPYLVLEYVDGEPIDRHVAARGLDAAATVRLFLDVLDAVAHAHQRLILHRDLKPSNILVTADGQAKLLDFGIAKLLDEAQQAAAATELTQRAGRAFTPQYAAPEQLAGGDVTTATDVYALGVLLYGLLGGGHPTPAAATAHTAPLERMRAVVEAAPRRLSDAVRAAGGAAGGADTARRARALRGDLDTIVAKALKKAPAERYASAAELAADLRRWAAHEPIAARPDSRWYVATRFVRRHRAAVAAGSAAVLVLGGAIASALVEGREAQRQREQAEGLIGFMLGELRQKLQPVGRLDVLDAVGDKALAYYAAQDPARLDVDALGRRARALHLIGEVAEQRGRLEDAARIFGQAADSTAELLARAPQQPQRLFDHAQSVFWLGNLARQRGQRDEAQRHFERYLALAQELVRLEPGKVEWQDEVGYAQSSLGVLHLDAGRPAQALAAFETVKKLQQTQLESRPPVRFELAKTLGWIADCHERVGALRAAVKVQEERAALLKASPGLAADRPSTRLLAFTTEAVGSLRLALGDLDLAIAAFDEARALYEALLGREADNLELVGRYAMLNTSLAGAYYWSTGRTVEAGTSLERAMATMPRLLKADSRKVQWQFWLRGNVAMLRERLAATRPVALGDGELNAALDGAYRLIGDGAVFNPRERTLLSELETAVGDRLAQQGRRDEAVRHWETALARVSDAEGGGSHPRSMTAQAHALLRLGRLKEALALVDRVEASEFRHPVYADLRRRLAAQP